jgi:hypothetical protein
LQQNANFAEKSQRLFCLEADPGVGKVQLWRVSALLLAVCRRFALQIPKGIVRAEQFLKMLHSDNSRRFIAKGYPQLPGKCSPQGYFSTGVQGEVSANLGGKKVD